MKYLTQTSSNYHKTGLLGQLRLVKEYFETRRRKSNQTSISNAAKGIMVLEHIHK